MNYTESTITFENNNEKIFGIIHHSQDAKLEDKPFIIFLHGFAGYRIGPHQLFVKAARFLAKKGYSSLRFDFRGRGYSEGKKEATSYKSMVDDLDVVIQSVNKKYKPSHIILTGICSGARTALYYIKNREQTVHSLIELSSPYLWTSNEVSAATSSTKNVINGYFQKAKNIENWKRLTRGEVNINMISNILKNNISRYSSALKNKVLKKEKIARDKNSGKNSYANFDGEVLLIHGEKDPETFITMKQIHSLLQKHEIQYKDLIIKNANHSFYALHWENEIKEAIYDWIRNRFPLQ